MHAAATTTTVLFTALLLVPLSAPAADLPDGNAVIRARAGSSEIVIRTTARLAGAIDSLTWNGREFINSTDHGRQLQSASNLDCGTPIFAPPQPAPDTTGPSYGRWRFIAQKVVKWNCVFRLKTVMESRQATMCSA